MNNSSAKIRLGLVGCGSRLRSVLRLLLGQGEGRLEVTAVYDPSPASLEAMANDGIAVTPSPSAEAVCTSPDVDWVLIGSWNCFHARQVLAAFEAGKDVFCEKPLATSFDDCLSLHKAWQKSQRTFFFGLVMRYVPFYQRIKQLLDDGAIGQVLSLEFNETLPFNHGGYIHGNWRRHRANAGTHLLEKCCHDIDMVNWLTNSLPVRVASFGARDFFRPENSAFAMSLGTDACLRPAYQTWPDPARVDPFSEGASIVDNQVAILEYANGVRATFHTNCNAALPERRVYILGTRGTLRADALTRQIELEKIGFNSSREQISVTREREDDHFGGDVVMARHLSRTMLTGTPPQAGMDEGVRSALSCFGIDEALDTGRVIDLHPLWNRAGISVPESSLPKQETGEGKLTPEAHSLPTQANP